MRDRLFDGFDARRRHLAPIRIIEIQRLAKRQQRDVRRVGSQKKRFSKPGLTVSNDRNFMVDYFVAVANATVPDEPLLNRIEQIRKLRLLIDDAFSP